MVGVTADGDRVLVDAAGPSPSPDPMLLHKDLVAAGLSGVDVEVSLTPKSYTRVPT